MASESEALNVLSYVLWGFILYITVECFNSWCYIYPCWQYHPKKLTKLSFLLLFNFFSNVFSYLVTWIYCYYDFPNKNGAYMFIEGLGHLMMANSYLWLIYSRLCVFSTANNSRFWFWVCCLQPLITVVDVLLFTLDKGGVIHSVFKYTGTIFFMMVILIEAGMNCQLIFVLYRNLKLITNQEGTTTMFRRRFLLQSILCLLAQIMIDLALMCLNFLVDPLSFILTKRLIFTVKSRILVHLFHETKAVYAIQPTNASHATCNSKASKNSKNSKSSRNSKNKQIKCSTSGVFIERSYLGTNTDNNASHIQSDSAMGHRGPKQRTFTNCNSVMISGLISRSLSIDMDVEKEGAVPRNFVDINVVEMEQEPDILPIPQTQIGCSSLGNLTDSRINSTSSILLKSNAKQQQQQGMNTVLVDSTNVLNVDSSEIFVATIDLH